MSKNWFSVAAAAKGDKGASAVEIYIFDYIGSGEVSARSFIDQLKAVDADQIDLHINSPGGSVFDGVAIQNSLKHHKARVTVFIDGIAASIASIIALAGDEIKIAENAYVMIHNPASIVWGDAKDMLKEAEVLDKLADGLAGDYSRRMGITAEEARVLMDDETWYLGQEAVDAGFADAIFQGSKATASFKIDAVPTKAPADAVARFFSAGRPHNTQEKEMMDKNELQQSSEGQEVTSGQDAGVAETVTVATVQPPVDVKSAVAEALKIDRQRQADIRDLGQRFGFDADAETFANSDKSLSDFQAHILAKSPDAWKASLAIKNPAQQQTESESQELAEGSAAVAKIKEKRKARFGN